MNAHKSFLIEISEVDQLNSLKYERITATQICKKLQALFPLQAFDKLFILRAFLYITDLKLSDASPIMGWSGLGGELNDEKVDQFIKVPECQSKMVLQH